MQTIGVKRPPFPGAHRSRHGRRNVPTRFSTQSRKTHPHKAIFSKKDNNLGRTSITTHFSVARNADFERIYFVPKPKKDHWDQFRSAGSILYGDCFTITTLLLQPLRFTDCDLTLFGHTFSFFWCFPVQDRCRFRMSRLVLVLRPSRLLPSLIRETLTRNVTVVISMLQGSFLMLYLTVLMERTASCLPLRVPCRAARGQRTVLD
jgi:hypothetical protein